MPSTGPSTAPIGLERTEINSLRMSTRLLVDQNIFDAGKCSYRAEAEGKIKPACRPESRLGRDRSFFPRERVHEAIANGIFVAAVNRTGYEGTKESGLEFWGSSFVADPFGQIIAEASTNKEEILVVECDPRRMDDIRRNWPFLRDRRIDAYGGLTSRFLA